MTESADYQNAPLLAQLALGHKSRYIEHYQPELLQAVPRSLNRNQLNLSAPLPFHGYDRWNMYELSWLNPKGKPQVAIGEAFINALSVNLVESKSFKLYLNSFNQTSFTDIEQVQQTIENDLKQCVQGPVSVSLYPIDTPVKIAGIAGENLDTLDIEVTDYQFDDSLLAGATEPTQQISETLYSNLLKSNCLVTSQPDWGSICIRYQGAKINREALLRYIISFRRHNEFHEQCVERIFMDIQRYCKPDKLTVEARYTRRGGLDINPFRSNFEAQADHHRLIRQ
ncbi:NADPH-dependent 7-cyano-7-deazaguanine reductase QueF [Celerinatantimonas diazotrophica]|uniref:NADPH-dependent 7-cyano-7-deazaguanine reductase n=1 Tax=Celerinatantimonas diazotrophica TaxID=412034 RepID=A0A4V2PNJ5_9GAMM|nr:NADPH-dependent 7-cyano-7-deazaguanine reductase QueF [Celerinatantimonas diazotrophica]TCK47271.1 7-cyano-7-deazaguanine reductase [Celerinatantimonas diazotrophica]CAG9296043.1 NADPH-dependent 7-cyano-7-deazaguanine reductase [Celerinatantimonas diazotrophica]